MRTRRTYLGLVATGVVGALAGCADGSGDSDDTEAGEDNEESEPGDDEDTEPTGGTQRPTETLSTSTPTGPVTLGTPTQTTNLDADDGDNQDNFGTAARLDDTASTALVTAPGDENPNGSEGGSAYVYTHSGGSWSEQAKLSATDGDSDDNFGTAGALSGDGQRAIVTAGGDEDPNGPGSGSAYVFSRANGSWTQQSKLIADDGDADDTFGSAVALDETGTTALIAASNDDDPYGSNSGSVYAFTLTENVWVQQAKINPTDGDPGDRFGASVALSDDGTTALIGAAEDASPGSEGQGSVYVYQSVSGGWTQQTKLTGDEGNSEDRFGGAVAIGNSGSTALIGAPGDVDANGTEAGSMYLFTATGGTWSQQVKLAADDGDPLDEFGTTVSLTGDGTTALVSAPGDEDPNGPDAGSAYLFTRSEGTWSQYSKLVADNGDSDDGFGVSATLADGGAMALIGAPRDEDLHGPTSGSAYVYDLT